MLELETSVQSRTGNLVYAWINEDAASAAIGVPTPTSLVPGYWYTEGHVPMVTRTGAGTYEVLFPGTELNGGNAQVDSYGDDPRSRQVASWASDLVSVKCFDLAGNPANSMFTVSVINSSRIAQIA